MMVFSSRSIIRQVIQNIISNAIKYQDKNKKAQKLIITMDQVDDFYKIQFEDNGIGMSEERQGEIFNLFAKDSRNEFSTGVGFSVVKELLKKIAGEIKVESELALGTSITVLVPMT